MIKISPSVLACDFTRLGEEVADIERAGADMVHLDVMDGAFVTNISFGLPVIESLRKITDAVFDVHLMITEPIRYIDEFVNAGADGITVHAEACSDLSETVKKVKEAGLRVGVSIKPATPITVLEEVESYLDRVLVMTVET